MAKTNAQVIASNGVLLKPTPAGEIPLPLTETFTVELDTGRVVEMVVAELEMLQEREEIPNELTSIAARELYQPLANDGERAKRGRERYKLACWLAGHVLRGPTKFSELYSSEIWQIYNLANDPARAVDNFRRQQARDVGTVSAVQDVERSTEQAAGLAVFCQSADSLEVRRRGDVRGIDG